MRTFGRENQQSEITKMATRGGQKAKKGKIKRNTAREAGDTRQKSSHSASYQ